MRVLAIDLFCGLGGWTAGLLEHGYDVIGFDIERHEYGAERYPGQLVLQDVRTLHGSQFKDAALIVASPPCQEFSYMAMPFGRGKQIARALRGQDEFPEGYRGSRTVPELTALFDACFRIQREACEAAGHRIPMVVENVKGAQPWVGRAAWNFGSYYLWGDVPALMPKTMNCGPGEAIKRTGRTMCFPEGSANPDAVRGRNGRLHWTDDADGRKNPGFRFGGKGGSWFEDNNGPLRQGHSKSSARKAASARIAKIPFALSSWIAKTYLPPEHQKGAAA